MTSTPAENIWVVVEVMSGIPVDVHLFRDEKDAWKTEASIRKNLRPDYDEAGVFCVEMPPISGSRNH